MALDINTEITKIQQHQELGQWFSSALQRIQSAVNLLGRNTGTSPTSARMPAPQAIQSLSVKTDGSGTYHAVIGDANPISRGVHYFVEYDTDSSFRQPHVVHLGASRTMNPLTLPAMDDGGNPHTFFFRAYSQYPGGDPGPVVNFGGSAPSGVQGGGSTKMSLLPSTGSGTADPNGQQGASGFGRVLNRPQQGPKRTSAQTAIA
jgi:hypothetical protein